MRPAREFRFAGRHGGGSGAGNLLIIGEAIPGRDAYMHACPDDILYPEPAQQLLRKLTSALGCQLLTRGQRSLAMGPLLRSAGCGQTQEARTARSRNDSPTAGRGFYSGAS